jgi:histidine triad (HIT) family protein
MRSRKQKGLRTRPCLQFTAKSQIIATMTTNECGFCEPSSFSERTIGSNERAISLLSSPRLTPGHSLVIPRRHVEALDDLSGEEFGAIHELLSPIYRRLLGSIAVGVDVWQKTRPAVSQDGVKMDHVHFHVVPSKPGDERYSEALRWSRDKFDALDDCEREEMLRLLSGEKRA